MMEEKSLETFEVLKTKLLYSTNLEQICKRRDPNTDTNKSKSGKRMVIFNLSSIRGRTILFTIWTIGNYTSYSKIYTVAKMMSPAPAHIGRHAKTVIIACIKILNVSIKTLRQNRVA